MKLTSLKGLTWLSVSILILLCLGVVVLPWLYGVQEKSGRQIAQEDGRSADRDDVRADMEMVEAEDACAPAPRARRAPVMKCFASRSLRRRHIACAPKKKDRGATGTGKVKTWKRSQVTPNTSRLMIGDKEQLPLKGMQINVRIDGFRARVLLDCYFYNDRNQQFEGTFKLRLPNEATPYFFAFGKTKFQAPKPVFFSAQQNRLTSMTPAQIMAQRAQSWNAPRQARIVPKEKAAFAYTETVRRRVDPALMEWSGAGIFSARVFPLAPKSLHRIVIGYDVDLAWAGNDLEYRLDLPEQLPQCHVDLNVADLGGAVKCQPAGQEERGQQRLFIHYEQPTTSSICIRLENPGTLLLKGTDAATQTDYWATVLRPALPRLTSKQAGSRALFLVDVSLSANPERFNVWLQLLKALLQNNRDQLQEFAVLFFNVEQFWWRPQFSRNTPENVKALLRYARNLALEGATDLQAALYQAAHPSWLTQPLKDLDLFLLSDGAVTWGSGELAAMARELSSLTLFAYNTGFAGTDTHALRYLTRESGGAMFSVLGAAEVAQASRAHRFRPWLLHKVTLEGASDLLLAGRPRAIFPGQTLKLVGRGRIPAQARVQLYLRQGQQKQKVAMSLKAQVTSPLTPRLYGQVAVSQLEDFQEATARFAKAYATHFRITGRTCSLLMLESEADYQRFNIKPAEDAFVVKKKPASVIIQQILDEIGDRLDDPKRSFLAWLKKMEHMPGVRFKISTALQMVLADLPTEVFRVQAAPLRCRAHTWESIPGALQEQLVAKRLDYDAITREAQRRLRQFGKADALKALSSLVENNPGDGVLVSDVAFCAMQWGLGGQAYHLLRRVALARPYQPQTYHAMARILMEEGHPDLALAYFEVGLAGQWHARFGEFRRILGLEYLRFLRAVQAGKLQLHVGDYAASRLQTIAQEFDVGDVDLLIIITWNTDSTDVDLHVIEPTGEECYYQHRNTKIGGHITTDVTQGYGPEMYLLKKTIPGRYRLRVKYFSSNRNRASARTKVYATVIRHWGQPNEEVLKKVVTLKDGKEMHDIAVLKIK